MLLDPDVQWRAGGGGVLAVVSFTIDRGRITALDVVRNPGTLTAVREPAG